MNTRKATAYRSGWCAGADDPRAGRDLRGTAGHRRCHGGPCSCACHQINATTQPKKEPTR